MTGDDRIDTLMAATRTSEQANVGRPRTDADRTAIAAARRARTGERVAEEPEEVGPQQSVPSRSWYKPGRIVQRSTEWLGKGRIRAWVPCHDEHSVTVAAPERGSPVEYLVRCGARGCELAFLLYFESAGGEDDWSAYWKVSPWVQVLHTTTRHGPSRW